MKQKVVLTVILIASWVTMPDTLPDWLQPLIYPLQHANIFHLAANIICLWMMSCRLNIHITYPIAVLAAVIPSPSLSEIIYNIPHEQTMGFSGVLFAIAGMAWGKTGQLKRMVKSNIPIILITAFIPHVNALIHLYCLLMAYAVQTFLSSVQSGKTALNR